MWEMNGFDGMLCEQKWVEYDETKTVEATIEIPVSVCGKLRGVVSVPADADKDAVIAAAKEDEKVYRRQNDCQRDIRSRQNGKYCC